MCMAWLHTDKLHCKDVQVHAHTSLRAQHSCASTCSTHVRTHVHACSFLQAQAGLPDPCAVPGWPWSHPTVSPGIPRYHRASHSTRLRAVFFHARAFRSLLPPGEPRAMRAGPVSLIRDGETEPRPTAPGPGLGPWSLPAFLPLGLAGAGRNLPRAPTAAFPAGESHRLPACGDERTHNGLRHGWHRNWC